MNGNRVQRKDTTAFASRMTYEFSSLILLSFSRRSAPATVQEQLLELQRAT